jgi:tRNA pseudouridine55 synthase
MGRIKKGNEINGWINLDKPVGISSFQAIAQLRKIFKPKKIGHAGTLDPLASGVLPVALGEATKTITYTQDKIKTYSFEVTFGEQRSTDDAEGDIIKSTEHIPDADQINIALKSFSGKIQQQPPKFSAIKINGERAYKLARKGQDTELAHREVYIESLVMSELNANKAKFICVCGKGTYIRSLARDISIHCGSLGYVSELIRESVGPFNRQTAISLANLTKIDHIAGLEDVLFPVEFVLDDIPALDLTQEEAIRLRNGQRIQINAERLLNNKNKLQSNSVPGPIKSLARHNEKPLAIVDLHESEIRPVRIFNL